MPAGLAGFCGDRSVEAPLPRVLLAVGEQRHPAPELAAELHDVAAGDPRDVVGHLPHLQVLRLRPLIEGRSVHRGVAAPAEVGKRAADAGTRGFLEAADAGARILVLALQIGLEVDDGGHVAESHFVQQVRRERVRHAEHDVLAARAERRVAERGIRARIVHPLIVPAVAAEDAVRGVQRLIDAHRHLIGVQLAHRRPRERAGRGVRIGHESARNRAPAATAGSAGMTLLGNGCRVSGS